MLNQEYSIQVKYNSQGNQIPINIGCPKAVLNSQSSRYNLVKNVPKLKGIKKQNLWFLSQSCSWGVAPFVASIGSASAPFLPANNQNHFLRTHLTISSQSLRLTSKRCN